MNKKLVYTRLKGLHRRIDEKDSPIYTNLQPLLHLFNKSLGFFLFLPLKVTVLRNKTHLYMNLNFRKVHFLC